VPADPVASLFALDKDSRASTGQQRHGADRHASTLTARAGDEGNVVTEQGADVRGERGEPSVQDSGSTAGQDELAGQLSDAARVLQKQDDPDETLASIVRAAIDLIPGADEGSISAVVHRRNVRSHAASSELPEVVDGLQDQTRQGPCLDAVFEQQTVRVHDMRTEQRWPQFAARAADAGAAAMLAFQLYVEGDNLGALNLYSRRSGGFDDESEHVGLLFASHAAIAYSAARRQSQLVRAVGTREVIGQAQGILMERHQLSADDAFGQLVRISQHRNLKLRDVAEHLVSTGELLAP